MASSTDDAAEDHWRAGMQAFIFIAKEPPQRPGPAGAEEVCELRQTPGAPRDAISPTREQLLRLTRVGSTAAALGADIVGMHYRYPTTTRWSGRGSRSTVAVQNDDA